MYFECKYCKKKFVSQRNYGKHYCEAHKKVDLLENKIGKVAYICYKNWRTAKGFSAATEQTFVDSKFFKSFINFVDFCSKKALPERNGYIKLMVEKNVPPSLWSSETYYIYYIEHFEELYPPLRQVEITLEYLFKISGALNCEIEEVFSHMTMIDLMKLISCKKLSPWLLLFMSSYGKHTKMKSTQEEYILLNSIVDPAEWAEKIAKQPEIVEKIKGWVKSLNI